MNQGADRIVQRILDEGRSRAEAIVTEAKEEAARIIADAEKKAAVQQKKDLQQSQLQAAEQKRCVLGASGLEARKNMLQAKQDIIENVFRQALQELANLDQESYFQLIGKMILAAAEKGDETVIISARDKKRIPAGFWEEINRRLESSGRIGQLNVAAETRDIPGGVILQTGGIEINSSFGALLEMYREELEPTVASLLFEQE